MFMHEKVKCESCQGFLSRDDALFDEQSEVFFCDDGCFEDWADDHFEAIMQQYKRVHVDAG
ncbi:hypothetical protein [Lentibacillus sp. CBA3610]|uniref:hypothetical protein n=1 Tax=Lentibacillus sp. CBA3610 TaxID=2518176 RepID=UPI0015957A98|nr:hypothetical protein [Lentibacillus sp. CBA3610]